MENINTREDGFLDDSAAGVKELDVDANIIGIGSVFADQICRQGS